MTLEEARRLAAFKQRIAEADRSMHEQALVVLLAAFDAREGLAKAAEDFFFGRITLLRFQKRLNALDIVWPDCPKGVDGAHCGCWTEGKPCCTCGKAPNTSSPSPLETRP